MLVDALLDAKRRSAHTLAVADGVRSLTYGRLTRLASVLRGVVLRESRCNQVGIMLPASAMFPPTLFAVLWAGRTAVPLNFLLKAEELGPIVRDAGLDLILTARPFADLAERLPARVLALEDLGLKRKLGFSLLRPLPPPPCVDPNDTAVLLYTSGTTAAPKGVELTQRNLHSNCVDTIESLGLDRRHTFLNVLPPFHVFGLTANVLVPIVLGATVHAIPRFSPIAAIRTIAANTVTLVLAVPSMYAAMLRTKSAGPQDFRSIKLAVSGGEPLPEQVRLGFQERFGVTLRQGYGLTETSPVVAACSATDDRAGTVGRPLRNVEIRIVGDDGHDLPSGGHGVVLVRGPGVMKGYYRQPKETTRVIDADGWFNTGDLGSLDPDGFLTISGRIKDILIIGGENVYPREIEAVLETHASVLQAAVIGVPDALRGEKPIAFVIPQAGSRPTEQDLRNHARASLASHKVPRRITIRDDLPVGPTGKMIKRRLRDMCHENDT